MASSTYFQNSSARARSPLSIRRVLRLFVLSICLIYILPPVAHTLVLLADRNHNRLDDMSRSGVITGENDPEPRILVMSAGLSGLRGGIATHSWLVLKRPNSSWTRFEILPWIGSKPAINTWPADGWWSGKAPVVVADVRGPKAAALIPKIEAAIDAYAARAGEYHWWPGPNSNTFVAHALREIPELRGVLPPTAIGKDYRPYFYAGLTDSQTGFEVSFSGIIGLKIGWMDGLEINLFGLVAGFDVRRPALKLPGFGRVGIPA
jgi:hypothetical protein